MHLRLAHTCERAVRCRRRARTHTHTHDDHTQIITMFTLNMQHQAMQTHYFKCITGVGG